MMILKKRIDALFLYFIFFSGNFFFVFFFVVYFFSKNVFLVETLNTFNLVNSKYALSF